jgi:hypothetical protein
MTAKPFTLSNGRTWPTQAAAIRQTQTRFADPDVAAAFREFHKVAVLRVVAAEANSKRGTNSAHVFAVP